MPLPNGLIVGTQRSGTTWVYQYLQACVDVASAQGVKETFFFDQHFDKGSEWYGSHFPDAPIRIEVAPTYFHCPPAIERIRKTLGSIRLACILRNPVERSLSLYRHYLRMGRVSGGIEHAITVQPDIVESSRYSRHLPGWLAAFGSDDFKVLLYEDLQQSDAGFSAELARHFQFKASPVPPSLKTRINPSTTAPNPRLAALTTRLADSLRARRIYWPINVLKAAGLRSAIYGKQLANQDGAEHESAFLQQQLGDERARVEELLKIHLPHWR